MNNHGSRRLEIASHRRSKRLRTPGAGAVRVFGGVSFGLVFWILERLYVLHLYTSNDIHVRAGCIWIIPLFVFY